MVVPPELTRPFVSVVIPAYNAEATLAETLGSLLAQTFPNWEAIVVDDGSSDSTAAIAKGFSERDERIHAFSQDNRGQASARNAGVARARADWLLFLDSDDWLLPQALARLTAAVQGDATLDAVRCGWAQVTQIDGEWGDESCPGSDDLFPLFTRGCAFPIHACMIRKDRALEVGPFEALATCEDWDFWQRFTRAGPRIGSVDASLVRYRMRPASRSSDVARLLTDGLGVIATGHAADPRVARASPRYARGAPAAELCGKSLLWATWCAGIALARGGNSQLVLQSVEHYRDPLLSPAAVAEMLFYGALRGVARPAKHWSEIWPEVKEQFTGFLQALESQAQIPALAERALSLLTRRGLREAVVSAPYVLGCDRAIQFELTEPLPDVKTGRGCERLFAAAMLEGRRLGTVELPVIGGRVSSWVLADALAAEFAWPILGAFFARTLYPTLRVERSGEQVTVWRNDRRLGSMPDVSSHEQAFHNTFGWTLFLQELWRRPHWTSGTFYDPGARDEGSACKRPTGDWLVLEVSEDFPDLKLHRQDVRVEFRVGGAPLMGATLAGGSPRVRAQELRAALTKRCGLELCRAAVREGLLGSTWAASDRLRPRLSSAMQRPLPRLQKPMVPADVILAPGAVEAMARSLANGQAGRAIACRPHAAPGTSASRRSLLPEEAVPDVLAATESALISMADHSHVSLAYVPDLYWERAGDGAGLFPPLDRGGYAAGFLQRLLSRLRTTRGTAGKRGAYDRHSFEALFAARTDPWDYVSAYEQRKYEQTLGLLPTSSIDCALELACAEGRFTLQLAPRVGSLVAADVSEVALGRARVRCSELGNVTFQRLDLFADPFPGQFDLIVCSEVLYYSDSRKAVTVVGKKLRDGLQPGGYLLLAHTNIASEEQDAWGLDWDVPVGARGIAEELAAIPGLRFLEELRTPLYRIQLFRRDPGARRKRAPERIVQAEHLPPPEHVARRFRSGGETPREHVSYPAGTQRLPVLMYHRVAPPENAAMKRYCLAPERFEQQLRYLRDSGFRGVELAECRQLVEGGGPLPGRGVLITFDDGYLDFRTHAWPLLKRYGFTAIVFVVTDRLGNTNTWDAGFGESVPLLAAEDVRALQNEGVLFGSHSATHRPLASLTPTEVVREAARSRAALCRELHRPVDAIAYPHGDTDRVVEHLAGAVGYTYGFTTRNGLCKQGDSLLALPRVEVSGLDDFEAFVAQLA